MSVVVLLSTTTTVPSVGFGQEAAQGIDTLWALFRIALLVACCIWIIKIWKSGIDVIMDILKVAAAGALALWLTSSSGIDLMLGLFDLGATAVPAAEEDYWGTVGSDLLPGAVDLAEYGLEGSTLGDQGSSARLPFYDYSSTYYAAAVGPVEGLGPYSPQEYRIAVLPDRQLEFQNILAEAQQEGSSGG